MEKTIVGHKENVSICIQNHVFHLTATMDTGNAGIVPTLSVDNLFFGKEKLKFVLEDKEFIVDNQGEASSMVGNVLAKRPMIKVDFLQIKDKYIYDCLIAITDRRRKSTNMLINRNTMNKMGFIVDPSIIYEE